MVVDFNIIIEIVTTDPKNETTIKDQKVLIVQTTIKEAADGFVKWLKVSKVIPKTKFVVVKLVLYLFFLTILSRIRYFLGLQSLTMPFPPRRMDTYEWVITNCHCY